MTETTDKNSRNRSVDLRASTRAVDGKNIVKIFACTPVVWLADPAANVKIIIDILNRSESTESDIVLFPELCLTGASCQDLFFQDTLIDHAKQALRSVIKHSEGVRATVLVGSPLYIHGELYSCMVAVKNGAVLAVFPLLSSSLTYNTRQNGYDRFFEDRWFKHSSPEPGDSTCGFDYPMIIGGETLEIKGLTVGVNNDSAQINLLPCAIRSQVDAAITVERELTELSARYQNIVVYANAGFGESTTDYVYGGGGAVFANGELISNYNKYSLKSEFCVADIDSGLLINKNNTFNPIVIADKRQTSKSDEDCDMKNVSQSPFYPLKNNETLAEILSIQTMGLIKRYQAINSKRIVLAVSGGLDSTLALIIAVSAADKLSQTEGADSNGRKIILGVTMPGLGTSKKTRNNAKALLDELNIECREISIVDSCEQHLADIGHDMRQDLAYENAQARERMQVVMDIANMEQGFVLGTGDMTELALGFTTFNGDHMSNYNVNGNIPKTLVRELVAFVIKEKMYNNRICNILKDILDTPISPELFPPDSNGDITQKTEEVLGPYEVNDFFMYYILKHGYTGEKVFALAKDAFCGKYSDETLKEMLNRFYKRFVSQQFKRSCMPDGPSVFGFGLSPRGGFICPSDAANNAFFFK